MDERIDQITDMPVPVVNRVLFEDSEDDEYEILWAMQIIHM